MDKSKILEQAKVRAGMLAAVRLGLVDELAQRFRELAGEKADTKTNQIVRKAWSDTLGIYENHGGKAELLKAAILGKSRFGEVLAGSGWVGKAHLRDVIGAAAYVHEVEKPLRKAGIDAESVSVGDALAAVVVVLKSWAGIESSLSLVDSLGNTDLKELTKLFDTGNDTPTKEKGGLDWKWIAGIGAGLIALWLYNRHETQRQEWDQKRDYMETRIADLEAKLEKNRDQLEAAKDEIFYLKHPHEYPIDDPLRDVAIRNAVNWIESEKRKM